MAALTIDVSGLTSEVREALASQCEARDKVQRTLARIRQEQHAAHYREGAAGGKIGVLDAVIDPYWQAYFSRVCEAQELVWDDPEFLPWLKKNDPMFSFKTRRSKTAILRP